LRKNHFWPYCPLSRRRSWAKARRLIIRPGGLIDETLYQAITGGLIAGRLDVTDPEPPRPDHPLLKLDQVIVTGHSAWFSEIGLKEIQIRTTEAVLMALKGDWPSSLANPKVKEQGIAGSVRK
jgi:phosphoglycerate dehydrogenase-like enzyme